VDWRSGAIEMLYTMTDLVRVLVQPTGVFRRICASKRGYGDLYLLLAIELLLVAPLGVTTHLMRLSYDIPGGLIGLWGAYIHYALAPGLLVFAAGWIAYAILRRVGKKLDVWAVASLLAYTWVPHTLIIALSVFAGRLFGDATWMPHHAHNGPSVIASVIAFGPSVGFAAIALRTALSITPDETDEQPPTSGPRFRFAAAAAGLILLSALGSSVQSVASNWNAIRPVMPGDSVPSFSVIELDGGRLQGTDIRGQVALIDFWATWCGPCVAAMPHLERLHRQLEPEGLRMVSINTEAHNLNAVRQFAQEQGLSFPIYIDGGTMQQRFRVQSFPSMFLVDRSGTVRHVHIGSTSMVTLRNQLQALLRQ